MTPIQIAVPESLTAQKAELESALAGIATEEQKLAAQRKEIQVALTTVATGIAVLSGKPLPASKTAPGKTRQPMSEEAKKRIAEGLRKAREAKAKSAQVVVPAPQEPVAAPADAKEPDAKSEPRGPRK